MPPRVVSVRVLLGLLSLAGKHSGEAIEKACDLALSRSRFRLKALRELTKDPSRQQQLQFMDTHPLIRDMQHYGKIVRISFGKGNSGFIASGDAGGTREEEPGTQPGPPAVYPPDSALGSLPSVALSSGPAQEKVSHPEEDVNSQEGGEE